MASGSAGAPPSVAASVLVWPAPVALEWLRRKCFIPEASPELQCLRRLALTGRALLMRPAEALRGRLLEKRRELYPDAGLELVDALDAVLDALDYELSARSPFLPRVELLVQDATRRCGNDNAAAGEIRRLFEMRWTATRAGGSGAGKGGENAAAPRLEMHVHTYKTRWRPREPPARGPSPREYYGISMMINFNAVKAFLGKHISAL
eukprot:tig00000053_g23502.t1